MHLAAPDSRFDLSLRFLSLVVSGAIALALLWHFAGTLAPLMRLGAAPLPPAHAEAPMSVQDAFGPPAWAAQPDAAWSAGEQSATRTAFVTVFRCEQHGRVTYADKPCEQGGMRVLRLPRS